MKVRLRRVAVAALLLGFSLVSAPSPGQESGEGSRKVLIKTQAVYPTLAKSMHIHGVAKLEAVVEPDGSVKSVAVKGGHPILVQSALTAVGHWKFEPAPRQTRESVEVRFEDQ